MSYVAPSPTPEQIANGELKGYDPYDLIGISEWWAMPPDHWAAAAATLHDEWYLYALTQAERALIDNDFERDCLILARANDSIAEMLGAHVFMAIVLAASPFIDTSVDRNTDTTRAQGKLSMIGAMRWINECAAKIGEACPYPEAAS